jgi:hypothetical protein
MSNVYALGPHNFYLGIYNKEKMHMRIIEPLFMTLKKAGSNQIFICKRLVDY